MTNTDYIPSPLIMPLQGGGETIPGRASLSIIAQETIKRGGIVCNCTIPAPLSPTGMCKECGVEGPERQEYLKAWDIQVINGTSTRGTDPEDEEQAPVTRIPDHFWNGCPALRAVRQAALATMAAPEAVLISLLCRMSAMRPAHIKAETSMGKVSLNMFGALLGSSSAGKSIAFGAARELYPVPDRLTAIEYRDGVPPGSGEGIAQLYFGERQATTAGGRLTKELARVRSNALMFADEAEVVIKLGQRSGSTLGATLRAAWTEQQVGASNVKANTFIIEPPYALGFVACFQPAPFAALLTDENTGTPQRFVFADCDITADETLHYMPASMTDPWDWYGSSSQTFRMPAHIDAEIRRNRAALKWNGLHGKHDEMRARLAVLLAVLAGKAEVDDEAWIQGGLVLAASDATLKKFMALAEEAAHDTARQQGKLMGVRKAEEKRTADEADHARELVVAAMRRKLDRDPDATDRDLRNSVSSKWKRHIPADEWDELIRQAHAA